MIAEAETREAGGAAGARFGSISAAEVAKQAQKLRAISEELSAAAEQMQKLQKAGVEAVTIDGVQMFDKAVDKIYGYLDNIQFGIYRAHRRRRTAGL